MMIDTDGTVTPCCRNFPAIKLGSARSQTADEIWNGEEMRKIRRQFLKGEIPKSCEDCGRRENWGTSLRQMMNEKFRSHFDRIQHTKEDGELPLISPVSFGVRVSNLCNLRCRSCSTHFSSSLANEAAAFNGEAVVPVKRAFESSEKISTWFQNVIPSLEHVYFAGGEPLLDQHHYVFLEALLEAGKKDVELDYNTNLSTLVFKKWDITKMWSQFSRVRISASLDAVGVHAEILRKGTRWNEIEKNFKRLRDVVPHVDFGIFPTVSAMNAFHLPQAIRRWIEIGMIRKGSDLSVNVLTGPDHFCVRIFNDSERKTLIENYRDFAETLPYNLRASISSELNKVLGVFSEPLDSEGRKAFRYATFVFDRYRNEKLASVFPELVPVLYEG